MQDLKGRPEEKQKPLQRKTKQIKTAVIEARCLDAQFQLMAGQLHHLANHILALACAQTKLNSG